MTNRKHALKDQLDLEMSGDPRPHHGDVLSMERESRDIDLTSQFIPHLVIKI